MDLGENTTTTPPPVDEMLDALEVERTQARLVPLAVAGAIASLTAVFLTSAASSGSATDFGPALAIATLAGCFIGLGQAPILAWTIARKRLALVLPLIYVGAAIASAALTRRDEPVWGIATFTWTVPLLAMLTRLLPDRPMALNSRCYSCGYDLSGGTSGPCSECSAPQVTAASQPMKVTTS